MSTPFQILISKTEGQKRHFSFTANEKVLAGLQYENMFYKKAEVTINNSTWRLHRKGFWSNYLDITAEQSPYTKTRIQFGWGNHFTVRAEDNNKYIFKAVGFWHRHYVWLDDAGQKLMIIKSIHFS